MMNKDVNGINYDNKKNDFQLQDSNVNQKQLINPITRFQKGVDDSVGNQMTDKQLINPIIKLTSESRLDLCQKQLINPISRVPEIVDKLAENHKVELKPINLTTELQTQGVIEGQVIETYIEKPEVHEVMYSQYPVYNSNNNLSSKYVKHVDVQKTPYDIAQYIKSMVAIKSLEGSFYVFNTYRSVYEQYDNNQMAILIDALAREDIVKIGNSGAYKEVINYLKYDHILALKTEDTLPGNEWAFMDCFIDINTGILRPNNGSRFITSTLQCYYSLNALCPTFDAFIYSISGGDQILIELIWEIIGYTLSSDMNAKSFFTFIGPKDTGKSLLINVIQSFFQPDCVSGLGISDFGAKFALGELAGKRLNICADLTDEYISPRAVGAIKITTGNDLARTERKFKSAKKFYCTSKLIFSANYSIKLEKPDNAFTERQVSVPFLYQVPKERQDKHLQSKLCNELSGIAIKAIGAYKRLVANNYVFPEVLDGQLPEGVVYDEEKIMIDFVESVCDFTDALAKIFTQDLYDAYQTFCMRQKVQAVASMGAFSASFNLIVKEHAKRKKVNINGKVLQGYVGIKLR